MLLANELLIIKKMYYC